MAGIHPLGDDGTDPPANAGGNPQQRTLHGIQMQLPGLDHQQQTAGGHPDCQIVELAHPLAEKERREDHHPERHGVAQNSHLARPTADQRPLGQPHHAAGLEQGDGEGIAKRGGFKITAPAQRQHQQQNQRSAQAAQGGELEGPRVKHHLLHHDPAVTPDGGEQDQSHQRRHIDLSTHLFVTHLLSLIAPGLFSASCPRLKAAILRRSSSADHDAPEMNKGAVGPRNHTQPELERLAADKGSRLAGNAVGGLLQQGDQGFALRHGGRERERRLHLGQHGTLGKLSLCNKAVGIGHA